MSGKTRIFLVFWLLFLVVGRGGLRAGEWSEPNLVLEWDYPFGYGMHPHVSENELTMYYGRMSHTVTWELVEAYREDPNSEFTSERIVTELGAALEPWVSSDELRMYYTMEEPNGLRLIKFANRPNTSTLWEPNRPITEINSGGAASPSLTADGLTIFWSSNKTDGVYSIYSATRGSVNELFSNITVVSELEASLNLAACPSVSPDGMEIYFVNHDGLSYDIYRASRTSASNPFGNVVKLEVINQTNTSEHHPYISPDGQRLYFWSDRNATGTSIWMSQLGPTTYHVDVVIGSDSNGGLSKGDAFATINQAINIANDGDTVLVWPGVYPEKVNFDGKAIEVRSAADAAVIEIIGDDGVSFFSGEGADSVLRNFVIRNCDLGIFCVASAPTISFVTVTDNEFGIEGYGGANPNINHCIFWGNQYGDLYNCQAQYSCIEAGAAGEGNISLDPLFVDQNGGDFHLRSQRGHYDAASGKWVLGTQTSLCIDAGDLAINPEAERMPNGARVNMGAYGNSSYASRSEWPTKGDFNRDGIVNLVDLSLMLEQWLDLAGEWVAN